MSLYKYINPQCPSTFLACIFSLDTTFATGLEAKCSQRFKPSELDNGSKQSKPSIHTNRTTNLPISADTYYYSTTTCLRRAQHVAHIRFRSVSWLSKHAMLGTTVLYVYGVQYVRALGVSYCLLPFLLFHRYISGLFTVDVDRNKK